MEKKTATKKTAAKKGRAKTTPEAEPALMELFVDSLKDIYWAEKNLLKALPKLQKAATSEELAGAIETHVGQTEGQVARLEQVFELIGKKAQAKKCEAMEGLIKEGEEIVSSTEDGSATRDVGIIMASQKVEHYEIATYGSLTELAKTMGLNDAAKILAETLEEEKQTDELLTEIAENSVNYTAAEEEA